MDEYSTLIKEATGAVAPVKAKDEFPMQKTGEVEGALPKTMVLGFGEKGISKGKQYSSRFDFNISIKEKAVLRKRHWLIATLHNAILKSIKKVELHVDVIDPAKPYNEAAKTRMEQFILSGFGADGEKEFRTKLVDTKKWNGDSFSEIIYDATSGEPKFVNYLMAETMWVLPNEHGQIIGYPQVVDGVVNTVFSPENIIHLKEHSDEYSFFGYSDMDSLYVALLVDSLADEFDAETLKNFAMSPGVLSFDGNVDGTELLRLRWLFIKQHQQQPGKPIFLNNVKQWLPMNFDLKNLDLLQLRKFTREKALGLYGVLPMQAAVVETGKLANPDQQIEIGSEYIRQEMQGLDACYNLKFTPHFKDSANLKFSFGDVDPKPDEERKAAETYKIQADIAKTLSTIPGVYTKDEIREITEHEPLDDGTGEEYVQNSIPPAGGFISTENPSDAPAQSYSPPTPTSSEAGASQSQEKKDVQGKPFAGYDDFADCIEQNADKENPEGYCQAIMQAAEKGFDVEKLAKGLKDNPKFSMMAEEVKFLAMHRASRRENRAKLEAALIKTNAKYSKDIIKQAKKHYEEHKAKKTLSAFESSLAAILAKMKTELDGGIKLRLSAAYKDSKAAIASEFTVQDTRAIEALLSSHNGPLDAARAFTSSQKDGFIAVMREAYEKGLSVPDMVKDMRNYSDSETYKLERVARTETNRFSNQGRFAGYSDLERRRKETYNYEWVGPSDDRTSEICADIKASNPYTLDEIMRATDGGEPHINCRHNVVRVVE